MISQPSFSHWEKNPNWWGDEPKLDKVTFKALETAAMAQAFANNELDVVDMIIDADTYQLVQKRLRCSSTCLPPCSGAISPLILARVRW